VITFSFSPFNHLDAIVHGRCGTSLRSLAVTRLDAGSAYQHGAVTIYEIINLLLRVVFLMRDALDFDPRTHQEDLHLMAVFPILRRIRTCYRTALSHEASENISRQVHKIQDLFMKITELGLGAAIASNGAALPQKNQPDHWCDIASVLCGKLDRIPYPEHFPARDCPPRRPLGGRAKAK
jgi:hypothetical protein